MTRHTEIEPVDPKRYLVLVCPERIAKPFVKAAHYSHTFPSARLCVGAWEVWSPEGKAMQPQFWSARAMEQHAAWAASNKDALQGLHPLERAHALRGVVVFSVGVQPRAITRWLGVEPRLGVELGRAVWADWGETPSNAMSWLIRQALRVCERALPEVLGVLTYADPDVRSNKVGHVGSIYQSLGFTYKGPAASRRILMFNNPGDGDEILNERVLAKIRQQHVGHLSAQERLAQRGLPRMAPGEDPAVYVQRVVEDGLRSGVLRRGRTGGLHVYTWALHGQKQAPGLPYPKQTKETGMKDGNA